MTTLTPNLNPSPQNAAFVGHDVTANLGFKAPVEGLDGSGWNGTQGEQQHDKEFHEPHSMTFSVTRQEIVSAAKSMLGIPFLHQGRSEVTGVDCVGLLVVIGRKIGYPEIVDITDYRRMPKAEVIRATICQNCDEIPLEEAGIGDFFLMSLTGRKLRHAAVKISDETNITRGIQPMLIHSGGLGQGKVKMEPISIYKHKIGAAFRVRGLVV